MCFIHPCRDLNNYKCSCEGKTAEDDEYNVVDIYSGDGHLYLTLAGSPYLVLNETSAQKPWLVFIKRMMPAGMMVILVLPFVSTTLIFVRPMAIRSRRDEDATISF